MARTPHSLPSVGARPARLGRQSLAQPGGGVGRDFEAQADQPPIQVLMSSSRGEVG